jgi:hypothetical protein
VVGNDPASGKQEVIVAAAALVPSGGAKPLAVDAYEFSADETRVLIYTNTQRVWRRKTRGDYWVLDVATRKLQKPGGDAAPSSLMFAMLSPDSTRVAFVREGDISPEALADPRSMAGNWDEMLTDIETMLAAKETMVHLPLVRQFQAMMNGKNYRAAAKGVWRPAVARGGKYRRRWLE